MKEKTFYYKNLISLLMRHVLLISIIGFSSSVSFAQAPYAGKLGVEAPGDVFVDVVKQSYRWAKPDGSGGWVDLTATDVDANGWPNADSRYIIDFRPVAEWAGSIDDPEGHRVDYSGTFKGAFKGQATLNHIEGPWSISNQVYNAATNTTTFDLNMSAPGAQHGLIVMSFTGTKKTSSSATGSGISEFKLIRPGYAANTTQVFTNAFINTLTSADFSSIRFMGVSNTNGNTEWSATGTLLQSWSNRKKITDAAYTGISPLNKKDGWPWELVIEVCNQANMDLWLNVPVAVDDNYITQLAQLVNNNLNANLNVYLEHSNEMWNFGFNQYAWNKSKAVEEVNAGTANYNYDGSTDQEVWAQRRHAKRTRDLVTIFGSVMGSGQINNRIRGYLAGVSPDNNAFFIVGRLPGMLTYLQANYGTPSGYIFGTGVPLYYGGEAAAGKPGTESYSVQQIIDAMQASVNEQTTYRQDVINLANAYNLPGGAMSYEGGPDLGAGEGLTANIGNRIAAVRSQQQKAVYKSNFANEFWDLGGGLAMQFTLASPYNRYGAWGLTDDINTPDRNYLFEAVRELIGGGGSSLRNPENPAGAVNGLNYSYYEGDWNALPNFSTLTTAETGTVATVDLTVRNRNEYFGFEYTGFINVPANGQYTFYTNSDDGSKLYIGSTEVVNNDGLHAAYEQSGSIGLKAGTHAIRITFFEKTGGEVLEVRYQGPGIGKQIVPASAFYRVPASASGDGLAATYYDNINFTGTTSSRVDATLDFNWGNGAPVSGFGVDQFSVRWSGQVQPAFSETYTFYTNTDDGVRLWVNNQLVIDRWVDQPPTEVSGAITLSANQKYAITVEYYENGGGAVAQLLWSSPSQSKQIIPQARLYSANASLAALANEESAQMLYPNPASSNVTVRWDDGAAQIVVTDATGNVVKRGEGDSGQCDLNIAGLPRGIYMVRTTTQDGKKITSRLVVE